MGTRAAVALSPRLARRRMGRDEGVDARGRASVPELGRHGASRIARTALVVRAGGAWSRRESRSGSCRAVRARPRSPSRLAPFGRSLRHATAMHAGLYFPPSAVDTALLP